MSRWKITIEYDGGAFSGWQKQLGAPSIQGELISAIQKFSGEDVDLHAAGRTDAGVHARAQVAHFDLHKHTTADTIRSAMNAYLRPNKIVVLEVEQVDETFHARFSALGRSYLYRIVNRRAPLALMEGRAWHISRPLDVEVMEKAAGFLIGHHDFSTFRAQNCQAKSPMRTLESLTLTREGEEILVRTSARSFLYHQVRNMVGTLAFVGAGKWSLEDFQTAFAAKDRCKGGVTAPAQGLCFWGVTYPE